ncbi:DUF2225 domain-containing protein [Bacillus salitolerans]|uniref:DUF2225 domain-containing protein n=1 Tax=Bacillus salitolerans TaxID=1437434 RepID=A0ABW4LRG6_9BACI
MLENLDILFDKSVKCGICKHSYKTKKVRSRFIKTVHSDSDYCSYYQDEENSPLLYHVSVCPKCGYSVTDEFSSYFPPKSIDGIQSSITSQWADRDYGGKRSLKDAVEAYKLGIYCATLKKEKHIILAGLYMRLAWIFRKERQTEQELRFMKLAVLEYVQSYGNEDYKSTEMSELRLLYLIGDLYRRLGDDKQAIIYLSKVIQKKNQTIEYGIIEKARDVWTEIREEQKKSI